MTQDFARGLARIAAAIDGMAFESQAAENAEDAKHLQGIRAQIVERLNGGGYRLTKGYKTIREKVQYPTGE